MITDAQSYLKLAFTGVGNYTYDMVCRDEAHLSAYHIDSEGSSTKLLTTQYSVTLGINGVGGTVAVSDAALTSGFLFIKREVPLSQTINLTNSSRLDMELLERGLDTNVMLIQQIRDYVATSTMDMPWRGEWSGPNVSYAIRDLSIAPNADWYICLESHTSSASFSTDLTAGKWLLWIPMSSYSDVTTRVTELETDLNYNEVDDTFGIDITGNAATATIAGSCTGNAATATIAGSCTGNAATATIAGSCPTAAPPGAVMLFALSTAPTGWLKMNGAAISRAAYAALFAAIGTAFGAGNGSTTFNLPDARGEFFRCWDDSRGVDSGRVFGSWKDGTQWRSIPHGSGGLGIPNDITNNAADVSSPVIAEPGDISRFSYTTHYPSGYLIPYIKPYPRNVALLACIKY